MNKDQLIKARNEAQAALYKIEDEERTAANKKLIGKCFRYWNSYGGDRAKWWMYAKVVGIDKDGYPIIFTFQTTSLPQIEIREREPRMSLSDGYQPLQIGEFNKAWRALQKRIASMKL